MSRLRAERGQTSIEWVGVLVVAALLVVALMRMAPGAGGALRDGVDRAICELVGSGCASDARADAQGGGGRAASRGGGRARAALRAAQLRAADPAGDRPAAGDSDDDGISDADELRRGTNPRRSDSDGDGLVDGREIVDGTDPTGRDTDRDGISDYDEARSDGHLDPRRRDTDGDGLEDAAELAAGLRPDDPDSDGGEVGDLGDGLSDADELRRGTDPTRYDTDGDGYGDGYEVRHGRDPLHDDRNAAQRFFDDVLDHPFDYLVPTGAVKRVAAASVQRAIAKAAPKLADVAGIKTVGAALRARRARAAAVQRLATNKRAGDAARDRVLARNPGASPEVYFPTTQGARYVDVLTRTGVAIESKAGRTSYSSSVRRQVAKDAELQRSGAVRSVEWHFAKSPSTGRGGPSPRLAEALRDANIRIVEDP